jgi:hypothetical protein
MIRRTKTPASLPLVALLCAAVGGAPITSHAAVAMDAAAQTNGTLRLAVELMDGSRVIGTPAIASVPVETPYAKMNVPLHQIQTLKIGEDHETVTLDLRKGDKLKGVITLAPLKLETLFGSVSIGVEHIKQINVSIGGRSNGSTWSARNDFSTILNPSGPWSYGWTPDGNSTFTRYSSVMSKPGLDGWLNSKDEQCVFINHSDVPLHGARPGEVSIHPGPNGEHSVVRWQAPRSCTIIIKGTFGSGDAGAMNVSVRHNETQLFLAADTAKDEPFQFELNVQQNDTVDFDVGCGSGGWTCGTTPIDVEIAVK